VEHYQFMLLLYVKEYHTPINATMVYEMRLLMLNRLETAFITTEEQQQLHNKLASLGQKLFELANKSDAEQSFSYESIKLLKSIQYHTLTVPKKYGGLGGGLYELVLFQEQLAQYDPAIALAFGWHLSTILDINEKKMWKLEHIVELNRLVVEQAYLVNRAATEPTSGSPTRGAMPTTTVEIDQEKNVVINGQKSYTSLSPALDLILVSASYNGQKAEVVVPANAKGVSFTNDWDMVGMRGTASYLLTLNNVKLLGEAIKSISSAKQPESANAALLHIPACYLGIALAARQEAISFARQYQPPSLQQPIIYTPNVQQHLGEMELALQTARSFMYYTAERYEAALDKASVSSSLATVKISAMRAALDCVDRAMKIVGLKGLAMSHPLQRLYRDVRFGLHNPPMEDAVLFSLAKKAIDDLRET